MKWLLVLARAVSLRLLLVIYIDFNGVRQASLIFEVGGLQSIFKFLLDLTVATNFCNI